MCGVNISNECHSRTVECFGGPVDIGRMTEALSHEIKSHHQPTWGERLPLITRFTSHTHKYTFSVVCPLTAFSTNATICKGTPTKEEESNQRKGNKKTTRTEITPCPPTFMHLHQRQPARSEAAVMILVPALAWAKAESDSEVTGVDEEHANEPAVVM
jgi:hypothetical protein